MKIILIFTYLHHHLELEELSYSLSLYEIESLPFREEEMENALNMPLNKFYIMFIYENKVQISKVQNIQIMCRLQDAGEKTYVRDKEQIKFGLQRFLES